MYHIKLVKPIHKLFERKTSKMAHVAPEKSAIPDASASAVIIVPAAENNGPQSATGKVCLEAIFGYWESRKTEFAITFMAVFLIFAIFYAIQEEVSSRRTRALRGSVQNLLFGGHAGLDPLGDHGG